MLSFPLEMREAAVLLLKVVERRALGGPGSGNFGHAGRKGEVGGSADGGDFDSEEAEALGQAMVRAAGMGSVLDEGDHWSQGIYKANISTREEVRDRISAELAKDLVEQAAELDVSVDAFEERAPDVEVSMRLMQWEQTSTGTPRATKEQYAIADAFDLDDEDVATAHLGKLPSMAPSDQVDYEISKAYARAEYQATQDWFAKEGITHVSLYRGMIDVPQIEQGPVTVRMQPASSWTVEPATAMDFAMSGPYGRILRTRVPVSRVLSTAVTGRGSLSEAEVVLLGGKLRVYAEKVSEKEDRPSGY